MSILFFLLLLVVAFVVAGSVLGVLASIAWYAIVGLVIGALARLLVKDTRGYGLLATILSGIVGALGGGLIANVLDVGGILEFIVALLVAAVVIAITASSSRGRHHLA
jgi:uncharacterized membrane protein YeaQ/YmgE (transglycosylase-associated protein family)